MKKNTRKEHIVPQAHIRYFSYKNKNTDKVIVIDKNKKKSYPSSVDNVACQRDFYEIDNKETNYWEKWYGKIEQNIPIIYNSIIINSKFAVNKDEIINNYLKKELSLIIISQLLRTEVSKNHFIKMGFDITKKIIDDIEKKLKGMLSDEHIGVLNSYKKNEDFIYSMALDHCNSKRFIRRTTNILMDKVWIIHKNLNYEKVPFVSSDNPVILYNFYTKELGFEYNGLIKEETIIYYPINKELLVAIYPNFKGLIKYKDTIDFLDDNNFVMNFNKSNYDQCERQVFCSFDIDKLNIIDILKVKKV